MADMPVSNYCASCNAFIPDGEAYLVREARPWCTQCVSDYRQGEQLGQQIELVRQALSNGLISRSYAEEMLFGVQPVRPGGGIADLYRQMREDRERQQVSLEEDLQNLRRFRQEMRVVEDNEGDQVARRYVSTQQVQLNEVGNRQVGPVLHDVIETNSRLLAEMVKFHLQAGHHMDARFDGVMKEAKNLDRLFKNYKPLFGEGDYLGTDEEDPD